jgi:drug/metabolite transporter (DMT)-like permease
MKYMSKRSAGHLLAAGTIIVWGTTFIASKILLKEFTPLQVMLMRFIVAYLTLFIFNHKMQKTSLREELIFCSLAILGTTLYFFFENTALTFTFASNVSILLSVVPLLTALLAHFFTKDEKLHREILFGSIIAFAGVVLVVFNGTVVLRLNPLGDILTFGAALSWAIYSMILKKYVNRYNPIYLVRRVLFYSVLTTLPLLLAEHRPFPFAALTSAPFIVSILILGVLGSGFCYVAWNIATTNIGIVTTNNYIYLNPFVTMVAAVLMLHEIITVMGIIGAVLIIGGVFIASVKNAGNIKSKAAEKNEWEAN